MQRSFATPTLSLLLKRVIVHFVWFPKGEFTGISPSVARFVVHINRASIVILYICYDWGVLHRCPMVSGIFIVVMLIKSLLLSLWYSWLHYKEKRSPFCLLLNRLVHCGVLCSNYGFDTNGKKIKVCFKMDIATYHLLHGTLFKPCNRQIQHITYKCAC